MKRSLSKVTGLPRGSELPAPPATPHHHSGGVHTQAGGPPLGSAFVSLFSALGTLTLGLPPHSICGTLSPQILEQIRFFTVFIHFICSVLTVLGGQDVFFFPVASIFLSSAFSWQCGPTGWGSFQGVLGVLALWARM